MNGNSREMEGSAVDFQWSDDGSKARFAAYVEELTRCLGHADRVAPFRSYCTGLLLPGARKSVEPMAARLRPDRTSSDFYTSPASRDLAPDGAAWRLSAKTRAHAGRRETERLCIVLPETVADHLLEVDPAPPHHNVDWRMGAGLHHRRQLRLLGLCQLRNRTGRIELLQVLRPFRDESMHPVAQALAIHAANGGRIGTVHSVVTRRDREQSSNLIGIARSARHGPRPGPHHNLFAKGSSTSTPLSPADFP